MKYLKAQSGVKLDDRTNWIQFITRVLAFIGLWQVLLGSAALLHRLF